MRFCAVYASHCAQEMTRIPQLYTHWLILIEVVPPSGLRNCLCKWTITSDEPTWCPRLIYACACTSLSTDNWHDIRGLWINFSLHLGWKNSVPWRIFQIITSKICGGTYCCWRQAGSAVQSCLLHEYFKESTMLDYFHLARKRAYKLYKLEMHAFLRKIDE